MKTVLLPFEERGCDLPRGCSRPFSGFKASARKLQTQTLGQESHDSP